ncbi:MAG: 50S ribosomal protein L25 [Planctomycetia bacterium]|nr:50S ribosomal protein L25 [Planctomycetia bacterium]
MAELEVLDVKVRDTFGKRRVRRLRAAGFVPVNLYGHGKDPMSLQVAVKEIHRLIRHGHHIVKLAGDADGDAMVKEVQWDVWGKEILHVDFARIDANEKIQVVVPVVLKGDAPGLREGGVVDQLIHEVEVECPAVNTPDAVIIRIGGLKLNEAILASQVALPQDVVLMIPADTMMVHCHEKIEEVEATAAAEGAEPEVITRKKEESTEEEK